MKRTQQSRIMQTGLVIALVLAPLAAWAYGAVQPSVLADPSGLNGGLLLWLGAGMIGVAVWTRKQEARPDVRTEG
ncbi:hypothetical protein [Candidatus Nitrospira bockiana]